MNSIKVDLPLPRPPIIVLRDWLNRHFSGSERPMYFASLISSFSIKYSGGRFGSSCVLSFTEPLPSTKASFNSVYGWLLHLDPGKRAKCGVAETVDIGTVDFSPSHLLVLVPLGLLVIAVTQLHSVNVFIFPMPASVLAP